MGKVYQDFSDASTSKPLSIVKDFFKHFAQ